MLLKDILKELELSNKKSFYRNGYRTQYTITYDYKPFIEQWNNIYDKMSKKTISKLEDYIDAYKFICDINKIMFAAIPRITSKSYSCTYIKNNEDLVFNIANNILKNSFNNGFLNSFKEPYIFLIERNSWEKETWLFGIKINKNNINDIVLLKEKLSDFFPNKEFSIGYEIKDFKNINLNINIGYFNRYNIIDKKINFKSLLKLNKDKLQDKLYKGGLFR